ncbi:hypothetical protein FA10DRAFT_285653 [Acaromyces ingoldii]|uniref:Uncharacterized protein n=1 Tax=Acaromyces ingoldii TaxID=215250 RepID=A0A316YLJ7_9BASI|nr:hypothetical protein FA10DRAFT_285653 [Acaromyces ingoldii]PWN89936.1 hypothetical protein FA10DRAFT_285653 [Acaromyces ingoldii]
MKVSIALFALAVATLTVANPLPEKAQAAQANYGKASYIRRESAQAAKAEYGIGNGNKYFKRDNTDAGRPVMYRRKEASAASADTFIGGGGNYN